MAGLAPFRFDVPEDEEFAGLAVAAPNRNMELLVDPRLRNFLDGRKPFASGPARWGELDLTIDYYAAVDLPPGDLVTSCRAVVLNGDHVLVIRDPSGEEHIIPGGRRVEGESMEDTVGREVLEETRWTLCIWARLASSWLVG